MVRSHDDKVNVNKLKHGDVLSFDDIFTKYHKKVYFFALSYIKNKEEAEDIVQEVFFNLWKFRDQINENYVFSKYLFKITYNATCKKFRKEASDKKHLEEIFKYFTIEDNSTKLEIEYNSLLETTNQLIEKLPTRQKNILLLNVEAHLNPDEIAQRLNLSKKTVENYLALAKTSLRNSLAAGGMLSVLFIYLFLK